MESTRTVQDRLKALERRAAHLEVRIKSSAKDLTYDKAEASAIRWALRELAKLGHTSRKGQ